MKTIWLVARKYLVILLIGMLLGIGVFLVGVQRTQAATRTFTVINNCGYTVYPGIYPASTYANGGWTMAPGASVTFSVPDGNIGRLWGRIGCDSSSPAVCTTGSCGGTGLQCAGTTGYPNTSLFEWNLNAGGTDWYDVSYVDAVDNPIGVTVSNTSCVSPSSCSNAVLTNCPADLRSGDVCLSPCSRYNTDQYCCRGAYGTAATCLVSQWAASAQTYVNNIHTYCPNSYAFAYDESSGALQTCATGASYTITFCPSGSAPPPTTPPPSGNLALNRPATSSSNENSTYAAGNAVDGNTGTRWSSAFSDPQWIYVDLGATYSINRVVLSWEAAYGRSYQIQVSTNASTWTNIYSTTSGNGGTDDLSVSGSGRYVRMYGTARGTEWGYSLWEFQVYGGGTPPPTTPPPTTPPPTTPPPTTPPPTTPPPSGNLALNRPATSSSNENSSLTAGNAVDGNTGTRWSSAFSDPQWIYVDLGATYTINRVVLNWEAAYGRSYQIQVSTNASSWASIYSTTSGNGGTDDLSVSGSGRYVRMYGTARGTAWGYSLWEFQVYGGGTPPPTTPPPTTPPPTTPPPTTPPPTGWQLVWSDEFNGSGQPNSANWNYHVGNGLNPGLGTFDGWGNGEWEWYRPENCYQSGGNLVLRADYNSTPTNIAGRDWYQRSCRITTDTKRSIQYGRIEARIQMPLAAGSWPAFWMMGDSCDDTSTSNYAAPISYYDTMASNWASCGEIDIMEHKNYESTIVNNIFWDIRTGVYPWTDGQNANYVTTYNAGNVAAFHTYALEWDQSYIRWYFDGAQTHVIDITPGTLEEFHKPFHLILNLALGGAFPAMDPIQSEFPLYMNVDYVRVYQQGSGTGVVFYQDINYGGAASGLKAKGDYPSLPGDVPNDWMSSLRVPSGWTVQAYENGNFGGAVCTFTADTAWVGSTCNDKMSSFRIY